MQMKEIGSQSIQDCFTTSVATKKYSPFISELPFFGFFDPILYHPQVLDFPEGHPRKFTTGLLEGDNVRNIKASPNFVEVRLKAKEERRCARQLASIKNWNFRNQRLGFFIHKISQNLAYELSNYILKCSLKNLEQKFELSKWLKSMETKNFVALHLPMTDSGPRLRQVIFSKKMLSLLGYNIQESVIDLTKYRSRCFDILDNSCYCELFSLYLTTFQKYIISEDDEETVKQIGQESRKIRTNVFLGKNERPIKAQIAISMPTPTIVCIEMIKVIKKSPLNDGEMNRDKAMINQEVEMKAVKSLMNVARIKYIPRQNQKQKVCSYVVINEDFEMKD